MRFLIAADIVTATVATVSAGSIATATVAAVAAGSIATATVAALAAGSIAIATVATGRRVLTSAAPTRYYCGGHLRLWRSKAAAADVKTRRFFCLIMTACECKSHARCVCGTVPIIVICMLFIRGFFIFDTRCQER